MEIELCGYNILVDDEDYNEIINHHWTIEKKSSLKGRFYFMRGGQDRQTILMHRFIMKVKRGERCAVDHINGNTLDNRKSNLRKCTFSQNLQNQKLRSNNTSGYKGVSFFRRDGNWRAVIRLNNKQIHLGYFNSPEEAYQAYCEGSKKYHGEYGRVK